MQQALNSLVQLLPLSSSEMKFTDPQFEKEIKKHGISPDLSIKNTEKNKTIFIEVKRQDGWVEGGKRSDGRGNAHERSNKFFTPGLLKV